MTQHHYTSSLTETAAAALNAGTCLEDGNSMDNTFSHIGDAVKAVSVLIIDYQSIATINNIHRA